MATWTITFYPYNIFELGTVTVTGTPDTGYPESRLYDRYKSLFWKDTVTEAKDFRVDQSASPLPVDFLAIPAHNFDGKSMSWQHSSDNFSADIDDAVSPWSQSGNSQIIKTLGSPTTQDYWRVTVASITDPQCSEIYMSRGYSFNALRDAPPEGADIANVKWSRTVGGEPRSVKFGDKKITRIYTAYMSASEWSNLETILSYLNDYSYPFYFKDHEGNYYFARFAEEPTFDFNHNDYILVAMRIIEN